MIEELVEALKEDEGYRISWKSNIAMTFKDEFDRQIEKQDVLELGSLDIHQIANDAAENFLNQLTK